MRTRRWVRRLRSAAVILDLALEGFFPAALGFEQLFFLGG